MTLRGNTPTIAVMVMHVIATRFQEWRSTKSRITVRIMTSQTPVHRHVRCVPDFGCPENGVLATATGMQLRGTKIQLVAMTLANGPELRAGTL